MDNDTRIDQLEIDRIVRDTLESFLHNVEKNISNQTWFSTKSSVKKDVLEVVKRTAKHYITHTANEAYRINIK
jgi:histone H3/H4